MAAENPRKCAPAGSNAPPPQLCTYRFQRQVRLLGNQSQYLRRNLLKRRDNLEGIPGTASGND